MNETPEQKEEENPEIKAIPAPGIPEYARLRSQGKIVFRPRKIEIEEKDPETGEKRKTGEVCIQTHDQQVYSVGKGGQIRNLSKPPRMSKKERRIWRKKQLEASPAPCCETE